MQENCRVCLSENLSLMFCLSDTKDGKTLADILEFISGIEVSDLIRHKHFKNFNFYL